MGYTHFDKVCGVTGIAVGESGSEVVVASATGAQYHKGNPVRVTQELTASGAVTAGVQALQLSHTTTAIAATIADASNHEGIFAVTDTSSTGTAAHTLTLTSGTFDGANHVATLNAPTESLVVFFDADGAGHVIVNTGSVTLST